MGSQGDFAATQVLVRDGDEAEPGGFAATKVLGRNGDTPPPTPSSRWLDIQFTGSGSEYFRIWIVNLLLTLVTLTLYWPFARARRMAYFQNNTLVGGDPLGFHADPWKMFRGYLLMVVLGVSYWGVSNFVPEFTWVPFLVLMALWPALWRASLQFRLRNTSWRGVRLAFRGDLKSAYLAILPFFLPGLVFVLAMPPLDPEAEAVPETFQTFAAIFGFVTLAFMVLMPWLFLRIKRYQHGGYAFAQERTELQVSGGQMYVLFLKMFGVMLLVLLAALAIALGIAMIAFGTAAFTGGFRPGGGGAWMAVIPLVIVAAFYLAMPLVLGPYVASRTQNLFWDNTRSQRVAFQSNLTFRSMFRVNLVNLLLIVITLGLYWPFAKVRTARVKLEAMALQVEGDVEQWLAQAQQQGKGVLGDAAGDFFGMDMGL